MTPRELPAEVLRALGPAEEPRVFTWAQPPLDKLQGSSFGSAIPAMINVQRALQRDRGRRVQQDWGHAGFPMDRFMAMLVTDQRLLVWRASKLPRRVRDQLTERPLDQVTAATMPYLTGGPWRGVVLETRDGGGVRFLVQQELAEAFVESLRTA